MREYVTLKTQGIAGLEGRFGRLSGRFPLAGAEVFCADLIGREVPLFSGGTERDRLAAQLRGQGVRRLHASYWASPSSFLFGLDAAGLSDHFGGPAGIAAYYGDTGAVHLFERWVQEYELACALDADAFTFHLIDYFPIDGLWRFAIPREEILDCMARMIARLVDTLTERGLLTPDSPRIELENAGWGLEYGAQTAEDLAWVLEQTDDPLGKLSVAWDVNHLLHAVGLKGDAAVFYLPDREKTPAMKALEKELSACPDAFAARWLERNLLSGALWGKVSCVHLSDCAWKTRQIFTEGYMEPPLRAQLEACAAPEEQEHFGEQVVLSCYDSHLPVGRGALKGPEIAGMLQQLGRLRTDFSVLHELKNSKDLAADLALQIAALS